MDRNNDTSRKRKINPTSLSVRRAWIEISDMSDAWHRYTVALRKESVDRNRLFWYCLGTRVSSLSVRRAWIEISMYVTRLPRAQVALRKESVDRNNIRIAPIDSIIGRSP